jgi:LPS sulfotransferase NodH
LIEISYESLVKSPLDTVHAIYDHLKLDGFDAVQPKLAERMNADKDYKTNRWNVPDALAHRIRNHCSDYCSRYGYEL